jgi:hypothetical protein
MATLSRISIRAAFDGNWDCGVFKNNQSPARTEQLRVWNRIAPRPAFNSAVRPVTASEAGDLRQERTKRGMASHHSPIIRARARAKLVHLYSNYS